MGPSRVSYDVNGPLWVVSFCGMHNLLLRVCDAQFIRVLGIMLFKGLDKIRDYVHLIKKR